MESDAERLMREWAAVKAHQDARHESAHAVLAERLGFPVEYLTLGSGNTTDMAACHFGAPDDPDLGERTRLALVVIAGHAYGELAGWDDGYGDLVGWNDPDDPFRLPDHDDRAKFATLVRTIDRDKDTVWRMARLLARWNRTTIERVWPRSCC